MPISTASLPLTIDNPTQLPESFGVEQLEKMPLPRAVLMCPPDYFDIVDVKNPFMVGQQGKADLRLARKQWEAVKRAFEEAGIEVKTIPPVEGCEDMVFCANPIFAGLDQNDRRVCVLSHMRYPSRRREVPAHAEWFAQNGYRVVSIGEPSWLFEGSGDALWHPGRRLIWGGYGPRTNREIYPKLAETFGAPVVMLELKTDLFYHLDTCLALVDENTAVVHPPALTADGMALVRRLFRRVIEADAHEAAAITACNGAAFLGKRYVVQQGARKVTGVLRELGIEVTEVDTSEFIKSGGSVFCMKMYLF
jgi:N-dimethylarginine dimethylaminohydrolase